MTPIPGHPNYGCSRDGRVWRLTVSANNRWNGREVPYPLRQYVINDKVIVKIDGTTKSAARLVLSTFGRLPEASEVVAYKDSDSKNIAYRNLLWVEDDRFRKLAWAQGGAN